tara:strand:- start:655 stop:1338 length:684 start_codon:yes stop_codon:yes gene_type:complete
MFSKVSTLIILTSLIFAENTDLSTSLFKTLYDDNGWNKPSIIDGISLSTKRVPNMSIKAVKVHIETNIPKNIITDIIMDIKNYNNYFINSKKLYFQVINRDSNSIDGYQFISVPIPFIKDREYFFRMSSNTFLPDYPKTFIHWHTLNKDIYSYISTDFQSGKELYLDTGVGIWNIDFLDDSTSILSYRLLIDPGGYLPDFAVDHVNKVNIISLFRDVINEGRRRQIF